MTAAGGGDLGTFTLDELRAAGVNRRGFLQPLLPEAGDGDPDEGEALTRLAHRGMLVRSGGGWALQGPLAVVVRAAAAARSVVAHRPAGQDGPARLLLGRLGDSDDVIDLAPEGDGMTARLLDTETAAAVLIGLLRLGDSPGGADEVAPVGAGDPAWTTVSERLASLPAAHRLDAAACVSPDDPLVQQRVTVASAPGTAWLVLGRRAGDRWAVSAAPAGPERVNRLARALLRGAPADL